MRGCATAHISRTASVKLTHLIPTRRRNRLAVGLLLLIVLCELTFTVTGNEHAHNSKHWVEAMAQVVAASLVLIGMLVYSGIGWMRRRARH
jgi:hypothetical protein